MAEKTRLLICRSTFLLLAFLPFVASVSWATYRHVALDAASYRRWIAAQTGIELKLRRVIHARPNVTRFEGLNIVDPENGELIARCDEATVLYGERATSIRFSAVKVQPDQFRRLLELLHERALRQQRLISKPVYIVAQSVALPGHGRERKVTELRLETEKTSNGPEAMLTFRWADRPEGDFVRLHLLRDHTIQPPTTKIELLTGDTPLPCSLLIRLPEPYQHLGKMTFQGNLHMTSTSVGWEGEVTGHLANVNLEQLAASEPSTLPFATGPVQITVRQARFQGSWMQSLAGRLEAGPGRIRLSALQSARDHLQMVTPIPDRQWEGAELEYHQMAIEFRLDSQSAQILGACDGSTDGVVLMGLDGPLALQAANPAIDPVSLARALFGLLPAEVPVSSENRPLLRVLPLGL